MAEYVEKQILVKSPVTTNGTTPAIGEDGKVVYRETILAATARKHIEAQNKTLPDHLKHRIEDVVPTTQVVAPSAPEPPVTTQPSEADKNKTNEKK